MCVCVPVCGWGRKERHGQREDIDSRDTQHKQRVVFDQGVFPGSKGENICVTIDKPLATTDAVKLPD
jgi:hypothetical protein